MIITDTDILILRKYTVKVLRNKYRQIHYRDWEDIHQSVALAVIEAPEPDISKIACMLRLARQAIYEYCARHRARGMGGHSRLTRRVAEIIDGDALIPGREVSIISEYVAEVDVEASVIEKLTIEDIVNKVTQHSNAKRNLAWIDRALNDEGVSNDYHVRDTIRRML